MTTFAQAPFQDTFTFSMKSLADLGSGNGGNSTETIQNLDDLFRVRTKLIEKFLESGTTTPSRWRRGYKVYDKEHKVSKKGPPCPAGVSVTILFYSSLAWGGERISYSV